MCENQIKSKTFYKKVEAAVKIVDYPKSLKKHSSWYIYVSVFTANLLLVTVGSCLSWAAPVLPKLVSNDTEINPFGTPITTLQVSLIAAIPVVSATIGFICMATISDKIGRKKTMIYSAISIIISLVVTAFAKHIYIYYASLIVMGFNSSGITISVPIYNSEIADSNNRARIGICTGLAIPCGMLATYVLGSIVSIKTFTLLITIPALFHVLLGYFLLVESPVFLANTGRQHEAISALEHLRRCKIYSDIEAERLAIKENTKPKDTDKKRNILDLFRHPASRKAFVLSTTLCVGQQTSGLAIIMTFAGLIFNKAGSSLSGDIVGIIIGCLQLLVFLLAAYVVDKLDRRYLMLFSSSFCSICTFLLSLCFYLESIESTFLKNNNYLPLLFVILFMVGYGLGYGPIPITLCSELFCNDLRSLGVALSMVCECAATFLLKFSYPLLADAFGVYFCFLTYSGAGFITFIILFFLLPETKGKSLNEIQKILSK